MAGPEPRTATAGVPCPSWSSRREAAASGQHPLHPLPGYPGPLPIPAPPLWPRAPWWPAGDSAFSGWFFAAGGPRHLLPKPCSVLVLLNPYGGKGKGLQLFRSLVQPQLAQADISFRLMLTGECLPEGGGHGAPTDGSLLHSHLACPLLERRKHAQELMRTEELGPWDALVVMSGDGLMHEVRPAGGGGRGGRSGETVRGER